MDKIKILVVDDEARMRKLVKDFLSIKGYQVLVRISRSTNLVQSSTSQRIGLQI